MFTRHGTRLTQDTHTNGQPARALDLGAVWARGSRLLRENWSLVVVIAGFFVLVPGAALQFALPPQGDLQGPLDVLVDPNSGEAAQQRAAQALGALLVPFMGWAMASFVFAHFGYAAIVALIGRARPTVGEALGQAAKVLTGLVAAIILVVAGLWAGLFLIQLVLTPLGEAVAAFLGSIIGLIFMVYVIARLSLTLPVMAIEDRFNPLTALRRSWRLTAARPGNVIGFWMILAVVWFVTLMIQIIISSVLAAIPGPGSTALLIAGLASGAFMMVWGAIYCAMGVAMHRELAGPGAEEIATDFE
jgi:hypothetical protein